MASIALLNYAITFVCLAGLGVSIYGYIVSLNTENDSNYRAMCDLSEHISCTKAFRSEYGKGFGLVSKSSVFYKPNSLAGILFYSLIATLTQSNSSLITRLTYWAVILSNVSSIYFAYILYFKLYDLCIVCLVIYVVNVLNLILFKSKLRHVIAYEEKESKKKAS